MEPRELLLIGLVSGLLPASIAHRKGRNFFLWWFYGAVVFIVALLHALYISPLGSVAGSVGHIAAMHCRNCGKKVEQLSVCKACGFHPLSEKNFCQDCGVETKANQLLCTKCGGQLRNMSITHPVGGQKPVGVLVRVVVLGLALLIVGYSVRKVLPSGESDQDKFERLESERGKALDDAARKEAERNEATRKVEAEKAAQNERFKTALIMAVSASPNLKAIVMGSAGTGDVGSAFAKDFDQKIVPTGGGEVYVWQLKAYPDATWYQVKHAAGNIYEVDLQVGRSDQQAVFMVDVSDGGVAKKPGSSPYF